MSSSAVSLKQINSFSMLLDRLMPLGILPVCGTKAHNFVTWYLWPNHVYSGIGLEGPEHSVPEGGVGLLTSGNQAQRGIASSHPQLIEVEVAELPGLQNDGGIPDRLWLHAALCGAFNRKGLAVPVKQ